MGMRYAAAMVDKATLDELGPNPGFDAVSDVLDTGIDIDKMWNAAQIVLAGSMQAQEPLMTGGAFGEDLSYGPAFLAPPDQVARVAAELGSLTQEELAARVDVNELDAQGAYPGVWLSEDPKDLAVEVGWAAWAILDLYAEAASQGLAILAAVR